ncbi:uncharacterized protein [Misgurnus anguillicaudatus]|uniref:uncharacterized protein n=1 Tax=Misgurnus anguillicaudatus TaxID=75329 RepID=UPI003CCF9560
MYRHVRILSAFLCLLLFYQIVNSKDCPVGQKRDLNTKTCVDCLEGQYNDSPTKRYCSPCSQCTEGSTETLPCTRTSDTVCRCKEGFKPKYKNKQTLCYCEEGSEIDYTGSCTKCKKGFFSDQRNSKECRKWKECMYGIKSPGNNTSDVVCYNSLENKTEHRTEAPIVQTTLHRILTVQTTLDHTSTTKSSIATTYKRTTASTPKNRDHFNILWLVMLCCILLLMGLLYHKCKITRCFKNNRKEDSRKDSTYSKPVEESGGKSPQLYRSMVFP